MCGIGGGWPLDRTLTLHPERDGAAGAGALVVEGLAGVVAGRGAADVVEYQRAVVQSDVAARVTDQDHTLAGARSDQVRSGCSV